MTGKIKLAIAGLVCLVAFAGAAWAWYEHQKVCCAFPDDPEPGSPFELSARAEPLGLMTSLPLFWPITSDMSEIIDGTAERPWQSAAFSHGHDVVPLDSLSPVPALSADLPDRDPIAGLERLAVIQPRGLSPADNVALDNWVRGGGRLLLVLDPQLTGHYEVPLGDPRLPSYAALIPPVVERWGLEVVFDDQQAEQRAVSMPFADEPFKLALAGEVRVRTAGAECELAGEGTLAQCKIGEGRVTLLADAAVFEDGAHMHGNGEGEHLADTHHDNQLDDRTVPLIALMHFAFSDQEGLE